MTEPHQQPEQAMTRERAENVADEILSRWGLDSGGYTYFWEHKVTLDGEWTADELVAIHDAWREWRQRVGRPAP